MRIFVISDLHDDEYALLAANKYVSTHQFDLVLVAGDITNRSVSYCEQLLAFFPDCLLIPGNNEPPSVMNFLKTKKNYIHEKRIEIGEALNIVGFGYSNVTSYGTPNEYREQEIEKRMNKLRINSNTILLLHCPPFGYFDTVQETSIGSTAIRHSIEEKQPLIAIAGHVHEYEGIAQIGKTMFIKIATAQRYRAAEIKVINKKVSVKSISIGDQ